MVAGVSGHTGSHVITMIHVAQEFRSATDPVITHHHRIMDPRATVQTLMKEFVTLKHGTVGTHVTVTLHSLQCWYMELNF